MLVAVLILSSAYDPRDILNRKPRVEQPNRMIPADNTEFLRHNAEKPGVVVLPSGLQYKILKSGPPDGPTPRLNEMCTVHYDGELIDGWTFDSSRRRKQPSRFRPSGVIRGWKEGLQLMRPGDRWMLYVPAKLGYGFGDMKAGGRIPGGATLIFDIELLEAPHSHGGRRASRAPVSATSASSASAVSGHRLHCLRSRCARRSTTLRARFWTTRFGRWPRSRTAHRRAAKRPTRALRTSSGLS